MAAYATKPEHDPAYITDLYDWASLGKALVVHVGGGAGYFAIALAKTHSNLRLVVQDVKFMMGPAEAGVPEYVILMRRLCSVACKAPHLIFSLFY